MDTGTLIAVGAVLIFYMRMIGMQWGKAKRLRAQRALDFEEMRQRKGKKAEPQPDRPREAAGVQVRSWPVVIAGLVLCLAGAVLAAIPGTNAYWWIPITLGVLILTFAFK
jgi:hypothetical protein